MVFLVAFYSGNANGNEFCAKGVCNVSLELKNQEISMQIYQAEKFM